MLQKQEKYLLYYFIFGVVPDASLPTAQVSP
jgi:hypothetical protein